MRVFVKSPGRSHAKGFGCFDESKRTEPHAHGIELYCLIDYHISYTAQSIETSRGLVIAKTPRSKFVMNPKVEGK